MAMLEKKITTWPEVYLPSTAALAKALGCRINIVSAALQRLRDKGVVDYRQGQRVRIRGRSRDLPLPRGSRRERSAAEKLCERLEQRIRRGELRAGRRLPKLARIAAEEGVGIGTVRLSYRRLEEKGLVRRAGKFWVAGSRRPREGASRAGTIVVLQVTPNAWRWLETSRTGPFARAFATEAMRSGVRLLPAVLLPGEKALPAGHIAGPQRALAAIRKIRDEYLGALVVRGEDRPVETVRHLLPFCALQRPVVWFNGTDPAPLVRRPPRLLHAYFGERSFTLAAADHLASLGHRRAAFVWVGERRAMPDWAVRRRSMLLEHGRGAPSTLRITCQQEADERLMSLRPRELARLLSREHRTGPLYRRKAIGFMVNLHARRTSMPSRSDVESEPYAWCARVVHRLVRAHGVLPQQYPDLAKVDDILPVLIACDITALIAARDSVAKPLLLALQMLGIAVPKDLSLVSYDNSASLIDLPVTTVDLGGDGLGYAAFHALLRDVPVPLKGGGLLRAQPRIADRGSVARIGIQR